MNDLTQLNDHLEDFVATLTLNVPPVNALTRMVASSDVLVASESPVATHMLKHTLYTIEDMRLRDGYRYEQDMTAQIAKTSDAQEAQRAFAEKLAPVFSVH